MLTRKIPWISLLLLTLLAAVVAYLSLQSPWVGDDIEYAYIASANEVNFTDVPIQDFDDVLYSQRLHYTSVNGRTIAHTLVQCFCGLWPPIAFALTNGLVYAFFIVLLCRTAGLSIRQPRHVFTAILLVSLSFNTSLTPVCQVGYIWMFCLALAFLYLLRQPNRLPIVLGIALAFVAGWGQEALNLGISGALVISAISTPRRLGWKRWMLATAFCLGTSLLLLSPAAWHRAATVHVSFPDSFMAFASGVRLFYLLLLLIITERLIYKTPFRILYKDHAFLFHALLLLLIFNLSLGVFGRRQLFGIELISLLLLLRISRSHLENLSARIPVLAVLTFAATLVGLRRYDFIATTHASYERTIDACHKAPDGATILHTFPIGDEAWPGDQFLETMEKHIRTVTGKTIHIVPASRQATKSKMSESTTKR